MQHLCIEVIGMKIYLHQMIQDLKNAFIYSSGYIKKDSVEIKKRIQENMALTNCKRIIVGAFCLCMVYFYAFVCDGNQRS